MIEYTVKVASDGSKKWYVAGQLHRTDGPAIEYPSGMNNWFGEWSVLLSESDFNDRKKMIIVDGKTYKLVE